MSVNHSSSTNDSCPSQNSSSNLILPLCYDSIISWHIYTVFSITSILLLPPLSVFILSVGFQRWKQRSVSSPAAIGFSDFFTYNIAVMELVGGFGRTISLCSIFARLQEMIWVGIYVEVFPWSGQMFFPILTCVERYMAIVHPITYLRMRQGSGVCIRNISTGIIWLLCFQGVGLVAYIQNFLQYTLLFNAFLMAVCSTVVIFCSLSILCVLVRPRPGEAGGNKVRVDQLKLRAFNTIAIILIVLTFRFGGNLICYVVSVQPTLSYTVQCGVIATTSWLSLPSSLVLPLLFLHREGKLPGCKQH